MPNTVNQTLRRVALLIRREGAYAHGVLRGIAKYADRTRDWHCEGADPLKATIGPMREWSPDGIIAGLWEDDAIRALIEMGVPTVDVFDWGSQYPIPRVIPDDVAAGRLAAEHLLSRGFRSFAFSGSSWMHFSRQRERGFAEALAGAGFSYVPYYYDYGPDTWAGVSWSGAHQSTVDWAQSLPRPVGVMGMNDLWALRVISACHVANLRVPEDVAVIGVDDDELLCFMSRPALSSVTLDLARIGYEAAATLERLMNGERVSPVTHIAPIAVAARASTDVLAIEDRDLVDALRFIRNNAAKGIGVEHVVRQVAIPRRTLERKFQEQLKHGPHEEIVLARVELARDMLVHTDLPMPLIAGRCGFSGHDRMIKSFKNQMGMTPTAYRNQYRIREV